MWRLFPSFFFSFFSLARFQISLTLIFALPLFSLSLLSQKKKTIGFEQFAVNDFEQFCINLANEKLQQHFNAHVFKQEQAEYVREGIDWSYIEFVDNQDVLDLVEKRPGGVIDSLDEACRFPRATAADFVDKLCSSKVASESARFARARRLPNGFTVEHYAGAVTYTADHFLSKNRDFVVAEHEQLVQGSGDAFVAALFPKSSEEGGEESSSNNNNNNSRSSYRFSSVASRFKAQLADLMGALAEMEPHYVRCVKPNGLNSPALFEAAPVLNQLRCGWLQ